MRDHFLFLLELSFFLLALSSRAGVVCSLRSFIALSVWIWIGRFMLLFHIKMDRPSWNRACRGRWLLRYYWYFFSSNFKRLRNSRNLIERLHNWLWLMLWLQRTNRYLLSSNHLLLLTYFLHRLCVLLYLKLYELYLTSNVALSLLRIRLITHLLKLNL